MTGLCALDSDLSDLEQLAESNNMSGKHVAVFDGFARTVLTYALAGLSGANFSPAVTLA